jgi:hypothetical protein
MGIAVGGKHKNFYSPDMVQQLRDVCLYRILRASLIQAITIRHYYFNICFYVLAAKCFKTELT